MSYRQARRNRDIDLVWQEAPDKLTRGCLFISDLDAARDISHLKRLNIQAVISVARGAFLPHSEADLPNYLYLPADDKQEFNITAYFDKTHCFIDKQLPRTNVLVHCAAGISRSASVVIAFLMKRLKESFTEVFTRVKSKRPSISPNPGFLAQLKNFELQLRAAVALPCSDDQTAPTAPSRSITQKSEPSENVSAADQTPKCSPRKTSVSTYSAKLLDHNIEKLKDKCLKLEISTKRSRSYLTKRAPSNCSGQSLRNKSIQSFRLAPQLNSKQTESTKTEAGGDFNFLDFRSKTHDPRELASYMAQLD